MSKTMRVLAGARLAIQNVPLPSVSPNCLKIKVAYAGVNRADVLQKAGKYPPPPGASEIIGLEVSGTVEEIGSEVKKFHVGDRVMALLSGGGYADQVLVEEGLCLSVPKELSLAQAAAIPENWITAFQLLQLAGGLKSSDSVLVHAAASGVGSSLLQLSKAAGCSHIFAMCGSESKAEFAKKLGATHTFLRHGVTQDDIAQQINEVTDGHGVDVILDCVGASTFDLNLKTAAIDARWILYGTLGGVSVPSFSLGRFLAKRLQLTGTTLRSRCLDYRVGLIEQFNSMIIPDFECGKLQVQIDQVVGWEDAEKALEILESNSNHGKVLLKIDGSTE